MSHYRRASAWAERRLAGVPLLRRNPRVVKIAALCVVAALVVNEVRGVVLVFTAGTPVLAAMVETIRSGAADRAGRRAADYLMGQIETPRR